MRILILNWRDNESPLAGGAEVQIHRVAEGLVRRGHEVLLLASGFPGAGHETEIRGVRVRRHGSWWNANFVLQNEARRECATGRWDIVLEDVNKIPFFTPLVVRVPVAVLVPHLFGATIFREANPLFAAYVFLMERPIRAVYRDCFTLPTSDSTRLDLLRRGLRADRATVVHNGLDFDLYQMAAPPPRAAQPTLVHLGRLMRYKSAETAVRAFALVRRELPAARLVVAGDGPDRPRLERLAAQLGIQAAVDFRGHVSHADKVDLLWQSHVAFNCSPKEGWGLTVVEANACGVPVVAARRPGLVDSVRDRDTGILVPYGDAAAFAAAALELLRDDAMRAAYAARARVWAASFKWEDAAVQTERVLRMAIAAFGGPPFEPETPLSQTELRPPRT